MLKILSLFFAEHGVQYEQSYDFLNHWGTYIAFLDRKFKIIAKSRTNFGSLPNRSAINLASYPKIEEAIKSNKIMLHTNYFNFLVWVAFILRGGKEQASLTWSNFCLSNVAPGKYLGCKKLEIINFQNKSMSVFVKYPSWRKNTGCLEVVKCTENKHTCFVHLYQHYQLLYPPTQEQFYCYKATNKLSKVNHIYLNLFFYNIFFYFDGFFLNKNIKQKKLNFMFNPDRVIGHNKLTSMAPIFAKCCGFDDPTQHKPLGKRALGITMLSNSTVSEHLKMSSLRHSNLNI